MMGRLLLACGTWQTSIPPDARSERSEPEPPLMLH